MLGSVKNRRSNSMGNPPEIFGKSAEYFAIPSNEAFAYKKHYSKAWTSYPQHGDDGGMKLNHILACQAVKMESFSKASAIFPRIPKKTAKILYHSHGIKEGVRSIQGNNQGVLD